MGSEALRQVLEETRVVVRLGSAGRVSPSSRDRRASAPDAERCAAGASNVPDGGGILEGGACPLLLQAAREGPGAGGRGRGGGQRDRGPALGAPCLRSAGGEPAAAVAGDRAPGGPDPAPPPGRRGGRRRGGRLAP